MSTTAPPPSTDPSLLMRLRDAQDSQAWGLFVSVYGPMIARFCRRRGLQDADAFDVSQEVLAKVSQALRSFEYQPETGRFRHWLGSVVRSRLAEFFAERQRQQSASGKPPPDAFFLEEAIEGGIDAEWTQQFHDHLLRVAMERAEADFDPINWQAFDLSWRQNVPVAEVAQQLNLPVAAVYVARYRILERLRKEVLMLAEDIPSLFSTD
ncbi:MAG: RNA polymerase sigma factor [Planctomycetales bacterium]